MPLSFLVYSSSATRLFSCEELKQLLISFRTNNEANGITGTLIYNDGNFTQVLEGETAKVNATFERIQKDPRHSGILELMKGKLACRNFPDWAMGFNAIGSDQLKGTEGFIHLRDKKIAERFSGNEHPSVEFLKVILELSV